MANLWLLLCLLFCAATVRAECAATNCGDCTVGNAACVWCESSQRCTAGTTLGPTDPYNCTNWKAAQCFADGLIALYVVLGVGGGLLLIGCIAIYCCCARCQKRKQQRLMQDFDKLFDDKPKPVQTEPSRWQQRRADLQSKYSSMRNDKVTPTTLEDGEDY